MPVCISPLFGVICGQGWVGQRKGPVIFRSGICGKDGKGGALPPGLIEDFTGLWPFGERHFLWHIKRVGGDTPQKKPLIVLAPETVAAYERRMENAAVPAHERPDYMRWVRFLSSPSCAWGCTCGRSFASRRGGFGGRWLTARRTPPPCEAKLRSKGRAQAQLGYEKGCVHSVVARKSTVTVCQRPLRRTGERKGVWRTAARPSFGRFQARRRSNGRRLGDFSGGRL